MPRAFVRASRFALLTLLAACGGLEVATDPGADETMELGEPILATSCPLGAPREICSGSGEVWTAFYRVGRDPAALSEIAQTFTTATGGHPESVRLKLRLLRALTASPLPNLEVAVRPLVGGKPSIDRASDLARGTLAINQVETGLPKEFEIALTPTTLVPLATEQTYALVLSSDAVTSGVAFLGVASQKSDTLPGGQVWWRGARAVEGEFPARAFTAGSDGADLSFTLRMQHVGHSREEAGLSCLDILERDGSIGDGTYWIDPDGNDPANAFEVYCDMETDGGGWTLAMRLSSTSQAQYSTGALNKADLALGTAVTRVAKLSDAEYNAIDPLEVWNICSDAQTIYTRNRAVDWYSNHGAFKDCARDRGFWTSARADFDAAPTADFDFQSCGGGMINGMWGTISGIFYPDDYYMGCYANPAGGPASIAPAKHQHPTPRGWSGNGYVFIR